MEVAELTARLVAETALFQRNMEAADATVAAAREQVAALERTVSELQGVLNTVDGGGLDKVAEEAGVAEQALKGVRDTAGEAAVATSEISVPPQAAVEAGVLADELGKVRDAAAEADVALSGVELSPGHAAVTTTEEDRIADGLNRIRNAALEAALAMNEVKLDALRENGAIPLGVTPSALPGESASPAGGSAGYYDELGRQQTADFLAFKEQQRLRDEAVLDSLRGPGGGVQLGSGDTLSDEAKIRSLTSALSDYEDVQRRILDDQRSPGGGLVLPNVSQSTIGGLEEYERLRRQILDDQRSPGGGIELGPGVSRITDDIQTIHDLQEAQRAYEAAKLDALRGPNGAIQLGSGDATARADLAAQVAETQALADTYAEIRDKLIEIQEAQRNAGVSDVQIAKTGVLVGEATDLRDKYLEAAAAERDIGITDAQIAKAALYRAELDGIGRAAGGAGGGGVVNRVERDAGGGGFNNRGFLTGFLPGGQRASAATVTGLIGLGLATGPVVAPAAVGASAGLAAGISSLVGAALTLKLAFADISSAAFKTQKAFDALTPVQQDFVQQLRTIDYGFLRPLEQLASQNTLPGLTSALHAAITPASTTVARQGVAAFGQGIGAGANELGSLFGSLDFARQIGPVFQADAGYVKDFFGGITNLADAFVRLENAAIPLTNSLDRGVLAFTAYVDNSVKAAQASGSLAGYFDKAEVALHALGGLLGSVGDAFGAFFGAVGFENSLGVINLFRDAFEGIAQIINQNKTILRDFFAGAISSARDVISLVRQVSSGLAPVLSIVNSVARAMGGWRVIIDALIGLKLVTVLQGWVTALAAVGTAAAGAETAEIVLNGTTITLGTTMAGATVEATGLRAALLAIGDPLVLAALAAAAAGAGIGVALANQVPAGPGAGTNLNVPSSKIAAQRKAGDENIDVSVSYDKNGYYITQQNATSGARRIVKATPQQAASALGISVSQLQAQSAPKSTTTTPAGGQGDITALPQSYQLELANVANETGAKQAKDQAAVYQQIRDYYDLLIAANSLNPANVIALKNARAGYVQGGSGAPPLGGQTKTNVLPVALQTAIDAGASDVAAGGSSGAEIAAINKAIAYVNAIKHKTDADYQERTSLYQQLASAKGGGSTAVPSGLATLPASLQTSLSAAETTAAQQSAVSGTFNPQNLEAQRALKQQDIAALNDINSQIAKQAAGSKELRDLEAERLTLTREEAAANKQITEEIKNQHEALASAKINKILGLAADGSTPVPGVQSLRTRERQLLLDDAKSHGLDVAKLVSEPLPTLIKQLSRDGDLPKSSVEALTKVNDAIHTAIVTGTKLTAAQSEKIQAYLSEISDTLKTNLGYGSNYRAPSAEALAEAVPGYKNLSHTQQVALIAGFAKQVGHEGTAPTGGAVAGVPLGADGRPLTVAPSGRRGGAGTPAAPLTRREIENLERSRQFGAGHPPTTGVPVVGTPPHAVTHSGGDVYVDKIQINIDGTKFTAAEAAKIAQEIRSELLKTARRNPTQTKGPNAGRRIGMN